MKNEGSVKAKQVVCNTAIPRAVGTDHHLVEPLRQQKGTPRAPAIYFPAFIFCCRQKHKNCQMSVSTWHFAASVMFRVSLHENIAAPSSEGFLGRVRAAPLQSHFSIRWPVCLETSLLGGWMGICLKQANKGGRRGSKRRHSPEAKLFWRGG